MIDTRSVFTDRGDPLRVGIETLDRHSMVAGATGSGKTRAILDRLLERCVLGLWRTASWVCCVVI